MGLLNRLPLLLLLLSFMLQHQCYVAKSKNKKKKLTHKTQTNSQHAACNFNHTLKTIAPFAMLKTLDFTSSSFFSFLLFFIFYRFYFCAIVRFAL